MADQVYESGYDLGLYTHWSGTSLNEIDLHNFTLPVARAAVRHFFNDVLGRPGIRMDQVALRLTPAFLWKTGIRHRIITISPVYSLSL